ncbi:acyltransferase domain-containing protein [Methylobacterium sp. sgz302541]|uniref:acyltransferase domain-containing protein n=1 Tax=unclassified Methylobacterium TaxID=2615210 RepID=UPI003D356403
MSLAVLLSGQGGQHAGMFALTQALDAAQPVFAAAATLLGGTDPRDLVRAGGPALHGNRTGQILCCVAALSAWEMLRPVLPSRSILAGYSIGDLAAWGCAGRLPPETVLRLAAARAEAMDAASGDGFGLAGIRGLSGERAGALAEAEGCHVAIRNAPDSVVVGGPADALGRLVAAATAAGAQRAVLLPVHTPSHTPVLAAATDRFREVLGATAFQRPPPGAPRLLSGLDGAAVFDARAGAEKLARQISETIDWAACLGACREYGATTCLELGPGHALATMARTAMPDARVHALEDFRSGDGLRAWIGSAT